MAKTAFYAALLCLSVFGSARAQSWEFGIMGGYPRWGHAALGSNSPELAGDKDTVLKGSYSFGASITGNTKGYYGFEFGYLRNITDIRSFYRQTVNDAVVTTTYKDRMPVHMAYFNPVVYFMPKNERWRPFITGGFDAVEYKRPHFPNWPEGYTRHYGPNVGGGIKLRLFSHALVRFDLRDHFLGKPYKLNFATASKAGGLMQLIQATAGISFTL